MTHLRLWCVAVIVAASAVIAIAQTRDTRPTRGTSALGGVVVADNAEARPLRLALVTVRPGDDGLVRQTTTDDAGRFLVSGLPSGRYTIFVSKPGWVTTYYGSKRVGGGPGLSIALADNEQQTSLRVPLVPGGVIAGRVLDEQGRPLMQQRPMLLRLGVFGTQRILVDAVPFRMTSEATTDDLGEFRFYGLEPGTYYVAVSPTVAYAGASLTTAERVRWAQTTPPSGVPVPPPPVTSVTGVATYYPGTIDPSGATAITIGPGEERTGLDVRVRLVPVARVSGVATLSTGAPAGDARLALVPDQPIASTLDPQPTSTADATGRFTFPTVRPGTYRLRAAASTQPGGPTRPPGATAGVVLDQWASQLVTVSGDLDNLAVPLGPASVVSGRVVFQGTTLDPPADLRSVRIQLVELSHSLLILGGTGRTTRIINFASGTANSDGSFNVPGVAPARYHVTALGGFTAPPGANARWILKSVTLGGRDVFDDGFEVPPQQNIDGLVLTFTDRETSISGRLVDANGRPESGHFVFLFPADRHFWSPLSFRTVSPVRPSTDGRYALTGLRPGDYYLVALTEYEESDLTDPSFLELLVPAAIRISIAEGQQRVQDLRLSGGPGL